MEYLVVKWLHILSSTILFGTGIGTAFYLLMVSLKREVRTLSVVLRYVVLADWIFTAPSAVVQPLSGWYLVSIAGIPWSSRWLVWSLSLYIVAVTCWLAVLYIQIRMRDMASSASYLRQ